MRVKKREGQEMQIIEKKEGERERQRERERERERTVHSV